MKILANFYFYNAKKENIEYDKKIKLSTIIKHVNKFIIEQDKDINFDNLVTKWSDLNNIFKEYGDIPLFKLLKMKKKFKICYGGCIKFILEYNKMEQITLFQNDLDINLNKFYSLYKFILKYLTKEDIINLSLISKYSYSLIKTDKIFNKDVYFRNTIDNKEEKENVIINFKKFFGGHTYNLYEVKKLGMFVGKKYIYLLIQSIETYNVEIMRLNKNDISEHEVIFRDEWTNYYIFKNYIYQLKYTKEKIKLNKIDKNKDEIVFISINVSNLGDDFDSEYFYNFQENKEIFVVSSEIKIYKLNHKKKKLKLHFDQSKKYKNFKKFANNCKIRQYNKYYIFIKDKFFLSLQSFLIYDIINGNLVKYFPEIRGVELVQEIENFYYLVDYRYIYLLSEKNLEIDYQFKKYNNDFCMNELLIVDSFLNNMQTSINDYIYNYITNVASETHNDSIKKIKLKNLFLKLNANNYCTDYYNDEKALNIKILKLNYNSTRIDSTKLIRIDMNKFIKKLNFEENIKDKAKKEIIKNTKCHLFFNELNDIIINVNDNFWVYHYTEEKGLIKYNRICIKTNEIIRYHNIIFFDNVFIIWKEKALKVIYYNLDKNNLLKNEKNKKIDVLLLENIEDESKDIYVDIPIFLFHSANKLYLISAFSEENKNHDLFEIKINSNKVILVSQLNIEFKEKTKKDEILIYAKFIFEEKFLVIFSSYAIFLFQKDFDKKNNYKEIKNKPHYIIGYFKVRQLIEEESCFIAQDDRNKKCSFFDVLNWIDNK